jgi:hypothetical protein
MRQSWDLNTSSATPGYTPLPHPWVPHRGPSPTHVHKPLLPRRDTQDIVAKTPPLTQVKWEIMVQTTWLQSLLAHCPISIPHTLLPQGPLFLTHTFHSIPCCPTAVTVIGGWLWAQPQTLGAGNNLQELQVLGGENL